MRLILITGLVARHHLSPFGFGYHAQPQAQQEQRMIPVIMRRPGTESRLQFSVPMGTPIETIIADHPGWEFAET